MTPDQFQEAAGLSVTTAAQWYEPITQAMEAYEINTPERIAAFLAQTTHETLGYTLLHELWGPTATQKLYDPPSSKARGLGNIEVGDGFLFRGRGLIQITGRANYQSCGEALALDLIAHPEWLEQHPWAARSAAWWWRNHGCNALADSGEFEALTRRINGGLNGYSDRLQRWELAKKVLIPAE